MRLASSSLWSCLCAFRCRAGLAPQSGMGVLSRGDTELLASRVDWPDLVRLRCFLVAAGRLLGTSGEARRFDGQVVSREGLELIAPSLVSDQAESFERVMLWRHVKPAVMITTRLSRSPRTGRSTPMIVLSAQFMRSPRLVRRVGCELLATALRKTGRSFAVITVPRSTELPSSGIALEHPGDSSGALSSSFLTWLVRRNFGPRTETAVGRFRTTAGLGGS